MHARLALVASLLLGCGAESTASLVDQAPCLASIRPPRLNFGVVERDRMLSRVFEIENEGDTTCVIESIRVREESPEVAITPSAGSISPGERLLITVALQASGDYENIIDVSMTTGERFEIGLSASSARATLLVTPDSVALEASLGCVDRREVGVYNTGAISAEIASEILDATAFSRGSFEMVHLESGGYAAIIVAFEPEHEGPHEGHLEVWWTMADGEEESARVELRGTGVSEPGC